MEVSNIDRDRENKPDENEAPPAKEVKRDAVDLTRIQNYIDLTIE